MWVSVDYFLLFTHCLIDVCFISLAFYYDLINCSVFNLFFMFVFLFCIFYLLLCVCAVFLHCFVYCFSPCI
jgi:hypothetical protein